MELSSEQIQVLLVEKLAGTIEENDNLLIEQLLSENEELRKQWLDMQLQLKQIGGLPKEVSEEKAWRKLRSLLPISRPVRRVPFLKLAAAAAIIAAMAVGFVLLETKPAHPLAQAPVEEGKPVITLSMDNGRRLTLQSSQTIQVGSISVQANPKQMTLPSSGTATTSQWSTLAVPATLDYKITLSDGSEVWLNAQSHLRFPISFQGARRDVYLQGEAYFKVSKDREHPFIVHTSETEVQVVGTEFNINTYQEDKVATALVEGAVITRDVHGSQVAIRPGVQAVYTAKHGFITQPFDETEVLSWMKGVYYFHNTPLKDLAKVLNRWYNVEVHFKSNDLPNKTFSGELKKDHKLRSFLDNLNLSENIHADVHDGKVIFQ